MTPVPYVSPWTANTHYLTQTVVNGEIVATVVQNNQQPHEGHVFVKIREAKSWLKDNGFVLRDAKKDAQ